jgi:hypothetical protein
MGSAAESLAGSKAVVHVAVRPRTQPRKKSLEKLAPRRQRRAGSFYLQTMSILNFEIASNLSSDRQ